jgi:hypothetical protein
LWLVSDIEFWALLIIVPIGAAILLMVIVRWTGKRTATLLERALEHKDERNQPKG